MAPRRARRASAAELARTRAAIRKSNLAQIEKDAKRAIARGLQEFAVRSMNSLAEAGPAWSGEFSASWGFAPAGVTPQTPGTTGRVYRYTKNDLPIRTVEKYVENGVTQFSIVNTSDHSGEATDQVEGIFYTRRGPGFPVKQPVEEGYRRPEDPHMRYQFGKDIPSGEKPTAFITAEKDWFETYKRGGQLQADLRKGFSVGFEA